ncbi:MAG: beta-ketoacyl-ACP synthase III [Thermodesulfovibrionales bacterium]|nr:beta-ketoacyl-ACP synthase III [Thermodesulfovibrionales bacterium]
MLRSKIIATGSYTPERILANSDLEKIVDTSDEWITERTGIRERRIARKSEATSDLAYEASKNALKQAGLKAKDIDLIIVATVTGDMPVPSTACILQDKLDAKMAAAFDINAACSGFIYALSVADAYIKNGMHKRILVVGAEILTKFTDWEDRTTCILFGDGAGAAILEATDGERGIISTKIHSDGSMWNLLHTPGGGSKHPTSKETINKKLHFIKMKGNETFKVAVRTLESLVVETLRENKLKPSQLSLLIPHQANLRIIQATANRLGLPMDKVVVNLERYGNTSAASVPIALDEAVRTGRIKEDDYILLEAFGGGLTWASALIKW